MRRLSVKSAMIAGALLKAIGFLFVALMNLIQPPYGGPFLGVLSSVYLGYDAATGPLSVLIGTLYALIAGSVAGAIFGWLYNGFADGF